MAQNCLHGPRIKLSSSPLFRVVRNSSPYVDKSLLIKELFGSSNGIFDFAGNDNQPKTALITAPSSFGKSVNMDMIKCFIGIQVNEDTGVIIPKESKESNYWLFQGLRIMEDADFVKKSFGKVPVLKVNFYCPSATLVGSQKSAEEFCRMVVHEAYFRHRYLQNSGKLHLKERKLCARWCSKTMHTDMTHTQTIHALKELTFLLHKHYQRKVLMLIDEYDSLAMKAMFGAPGKVLHNIAKLPADIVAATMRYNGEHVLGGILTGISYIAGTGLSADLKIDHTFKFLQMGKLDKYYGLTDIEVGEIFDNFRWTADEREDARDAYNNYLNRGRNICIYNMWSVMKHLEAVQAHKHEMHGNVDLNSSSASRLRPKPYWINSTGIAGIRNAYQHPNLRNILNMAVRGENISANVYPRIEMQHLKMLRALVADRYGFTHLRKRPKLSTRVILMDDLFLTFLLEQGCLTYASQNESCKNDFGNLRIPNREIQQMMASDLREYYIISEGLNSMHLNFCTLSLLEMFQTMNVDDMFQQKLRVFKDTLEECCIPMKQSPTIVSHEMLAEFLFHTLFATGYDLQTELPDSDRKQEDFLLYKDGFVMIIELKFDASAEKGLEQIFVKELYKLFPDVKFCPYGVKDCILIGLNFSPEFEVSVVCLRKKDVERHNISLGNTEKITEPKIQILLNAALTV